MAHSATFPVATHGRLKGGSVVTHQNAELRERSGYLFVDNIRFISMAAVVAMHSTSQLGSLNGVDSKSAIVLAQPFKFGTIGFFLISGFLMGEGLARRSPIEYMKRRLKTVFAPWSVWFSLFFGLLLVNGILNSWQPPHTAHSLLLLAGIRFFRALFTSSFWFVPNLLFSVAILLLFRRFLFDLRLGGALLACSSFYAFNLYHNWLPITSHSEALFGFVFYLWLGAWAARNHSEVEMAINRIPVPCLIATVILTGVTAMGESLKLLENGSQNPLDTLRFSNQAFSIAVAILIFRVRRTIAPLNIPVRATTFGIYLTHSIVLACLLNAVERIRLFHPIALWDLPSAAFIALVLIAGFLITYSLSLLVTKVVLAIPSLSWIVGGDALRLPRRRQEAVASQKAPTSQAPATALGQEPETRAPETCCVAPLQ